jgi:hypothetical protein
MEDPNDAGPHKSGMLSSVRPETVDFGSGQGRSELETAGVAALRQGFPRSENAGRGQKMPFMDGDYLGGLGKYHGED